MRFLDIPAVDYARVDLARLYDASEYKDYLDNPENVTQDIDYKGYLAKELRYDNFLLFANGHEDIYPHFQEESNVQFPVEFEYKNRINKDILTLPIIVLFLCFSKYFKEGISFMLK